MKKYLLTLSQFLLALIISAQANVKYTSSNLNLRFEANTSSKVLVVIPKGAEVSLVENCNCEWIRIIYNGNSGFVYSKYLTNFKIVIAKQTQIKSTNPEIKSYKNSDGAEIQSPTHYQSVPAGATALCRDGTYSFSRNRRGTCSHHGGVAKWLQ